MNVFRFVRALPLALMLLASPATAAEQASYVMPVVGPMTMATFAGTYLNPALRALGTCHNGSSAPANGTSGLPLAYQCWVDTTSNPSLYKIYDGASWITLGSINTTTHAWLPYLTGGTSGGVPYFSVAGVMGTSAALAQYGLVVGGGAGAPPATITACTDNQVPFGVTAGNPICRTVSGDLTFATGVATIGATKVTSAMLNADVFSTAHTWAGQQTFASPVFSGTVSGAGTVPSTVLADTTVVAGSYGGVGAVATFTVSAKGQLTAASNATISTVNNVTYPGSYTSGGIPYASGIGAISSSGALTQFGPVYGGGAGGAPVAMAAGTDGQLIVGQTAAAPLWKTVTGDVTVSALGAMTIGATKVTSAMLNADVFSTAHSWGGTQTFTAPVLGTPASGNAANLTNLPISTGVSGLGTGVATALATPSSANLAAALTDETGTGAAVFAGSPALTGTPTAPTAAPATNTTQIATTAYVDAAVTAGVSGVSSLNGLTGALVQWAPPQGRMTLQSGVAVMTTTQSAKTVVYYTSYNGGKSVPIYNGANVATYQICAANTVGACELTLTLGSNWAANSNYDGFIGLNGSTVTFCTGPDWTAGAGAGSSTARGTGAGSTELERIDGLLTNKNSMTCRYGNSTTFTCAAHQCSYMGSFRTNGSTGTVDFQVGGSSAGGTAAFIYLSNAYNRRPIEVVVQDSTTFWAYATASWRSANNSTANRVNMLRGLDEDPVIARFAQLALSTSNAVQLGLGIALDATNALASGSGGYSSSATTYFASVSNNQIASVAHYGGTPGLGVHYLQAIEYGGTNGTFNGVNGITSGGLFATVWY